MINFPDSPVNGQQFSAGGVIWTWDGAKWVSSTVPAAYVLPIATTSVLGGVKPDGTTIKAAGDGTISTTVVPMGDNRIINGDMRIDQRNNGASGTAIQTYTIDRWLYWGTVAGKGTWGQNVNTAAGTGAFPYCWGFVSSSAYASAAADVFEVQQVIEADMVSDFQWGTAGAQTVTLSFWVFSSIAGPLSGSIGNSAGNRSYVFSYTPVVGGWTRIVITIPGDTTGTWVMSGVAKAMSVTFDLGSGSTFKATAGSWLAGNYVGATGATSIVGTNAAVFLITGVKLEIGSVATPFNRQSLAKSMADCQRYYQSVPYFTISGNHQNANGIFYQTWPYAVQMRAAPTVSLNGFAYANMASPTINNLGLGQVTFQANVTAAGYAFGYGAGTFTTEL